MKPIILKALLPRLRRSLVALRRNTRGGVTTMFGLAMIPTFGFIAVAVDYGIELHAKTRLDAAADAASMVAITTAQSIITSSSSSGASVTSSAISAGQAQAVKAFAANAGRLGYTAVPTPTVNLTRVNQKLTATVSYAATTTANMVTALGISSMNFTGSSTSTVTMPTYINYYVITDTSQSMGVAATAADMTNLYNRVVSNSNWDSNDDKNNRRGCVFGCHVPQTSSGFNQPDSNENLAHLSKYGSKINLRIDAAVSAIQQIVSDAAAANTASGLNLIQIALYTMQQDPTKSGSYIQNVVSPPNSNFSATATSASNIELGANTGGGIGDSGFSNSINYFYNNILTTQGDGSTQAKALNYVFIITDGISDVPGSSCTSGHCTAAFDNTLCTNLKLKATVGAIYTTYNPIYVRNDPSQGLDGNYSALVAPYVGNVPGNLKACASSNDYYYEASDGPAITTGMEKLFASSAQTARLSN